MEEIKITPEYWNSNPLAIHYDYVAPDNGLWNVSSIINNMAQLWGVNAWGQFYRKAVNIYEFKATYKERNK